MTDALTAERTWIESRRAFWIGLALIMLLAAALRLLSYEFGLPYIDHPDEPVFYLQARVWRGLYDLNGYLDGYPPVYIASNVGMQWLVEALGQTGPAAAVHALRLLAVVVNLLTLVFIALTARLTGGNVAGWLAGAAWGVSPIVLENGVYATPDPLVYLGVATALWLAAVALRDERRPHWSVWSVAAGLVAILTKYPVLTAVVPGLWVAFQQRRRRLLIVQAALIAATVFFLLFVYRIDQVQREGEAARTQGFANITNVERVANNIYHAVLPLQPVAFAVVCGLGLAALIVAWRRGLPHVNLTLIGLSLLLLISIPWLAATFSLIDPRDRIKDALPATTAACVLFGAAAAQLAAVFPARWRIGVKALTVAGLAGAVFIPQTLESWRVVEWRRLPDLRPALRQWADLSLEPGMILVDAENDKTFNPDWGGIPWRHWFDWWTMGNIDLMAYPVEEWRGTRGMVYVALPWSQQEALQASDEGQEYLSQLLHLRDFTAPPAHRGPEVAVYRFWRMEHEVDYRFGERIRLVGYDQEPTDEAVTLRFYWQASATPETNYSLFVHLMGPEPGEPLAQADGAPASLDRPTLSWNDASETLIGQPFQLALPPDLPAGEYRVLVGLYDYLTGQRLPVTDAEGASLGDAVELMRIDIEH